MDSDSPIDLVLLHTFHEVARLGSVTAAAGQLGRSQPAISHRLRALEDELGVPLFEKIGRRLKLTAYGRKLQTQVFDLMALTRQVRASMEDRDGEPEGSVVVGTLPTVASHLLAPRLADFITAHPLVRVEFVFGYIPELADYLRSGRVDMLLLVGQAPPPGMQVETVGATDLVVAMSGKVAPSRSSRTTIKQLRKLRYLAWEGPKDFTFDQVRRYAAKYQLSNAHTPAVPHIETLRELACLGAGYTILPRYTVARDVSLRRLVALKPPGLSLRIDFQLVTRPQQLVTPAAARIAELLRTCCRGSHSSR